MAQLLVRNLADDVKERLKRRASGNGRSLEAEARAVLVEASETTSPAAMDSFVGTSLGTRLARKLANQKLTKADWKAFDDNMKALRRKWRAADVDFGE